MIFSLINPASTSILSKRPAPKSQVYTYPLTHPTSNCHMPAHIIHTGIKTHTIHMYTQILVFSLRLLLLLISRWLETRKRLPFHDSIIPSTKRNGLFLWSIITRSADPSVPYFVVENEREFLSLQRTTTNAVADCTVYENVIPVRIWRPLEVHGSFTFESIIDHIHTIWCAAPFYAPQINMSIEYDDTFNTRHVVSVQGVSEIIFTFELYIPRTVYSSFRRRQWHCSSATSAATYARSPVDWSLVASSYKKYVTCIKFMAGWARDRLARPNRVFSLSLLPVPPLCRAAHSPC